MNYTPLYNFTLLTSISQEWSELHSLTTPNKREYAERWDYGFVDHRFSTPFNSWDRPKLIKEELSKIQEGNYLWFTGGDLIITNYTIPLSTLTRGYEDFIAANDIHFLNNDSCLFKNSPNTFKFLDLVIENKFGDSCDQDAEDRAIESLICDVKLLPQRRMNSYLYYLYSNIRDDWGGSWQPGDFALHLPGVNYSNKISIIKEYERKIIK